MLLTHTNVCGHISLTEPPEITLDVSPFKGGISTHTSRRGYVKSGRSIKQ